MAIQALNEAEIAAELARASLWRREGPEILRTFRFPSFADSIDFVTRVAARAEADDHHPDILVKYNQVTLTLSTHDAGGLSSRDFAFAQAADELAARCG